MKKLILLVILALAASVAYVALSQGGADAGDLIDHYKCYQARHAKRSPRFTGAKVFLTDQFRDNVEVSVIKLTTHCSSANQSNYNGQAAGEFDWGLNCYSIRDVPRQERFRSQNVDVRDKLTNWNLQTLTVSNVQSLCVPSVKQGKFLGTLEGEAFVCYQAKTAKGQPRFQQQNRVVNDQFGEKDVRIIRPVAYCAFSEKKERAPNDDFYGKDIFHGLPNPDTCVSPVECDIHLSTVYSELANNDPIISCKVDYTNSVWFDWYAYENNSLILDTLGSSYDTVVAVFTGDKGNLQEVTDGQGDSACNNDADLCNPILLDGGTAAGNCGGCLQGSNTAAPCICGGGDGAGCCVGAEAGAAGCGCPAIGVTGTTAGSPCTVPWSFLQFDAWAGTTYHILVASSDGHGGKLKLHIRTKGEDTDADSCSDPHYISSLYYEGQQTFIHLSTMNATIATDGVSVAGGFTCDPYSDPSLSCAPDYGASTWFTYTPDNHQIVNFDASDSSYPTAIAVFDTNGLSSQPLECGSYGYVQAQLKAGHKYVILVVSTDEANNYRGGKLKLFVDLKDQLGSPVGQDAGGVSQQGVPDSITCYQVRQARHRSESDSVYDQFSLQQLSDPWYLTMGSVQTLCVPSNKNNCTRYTYPPIGGGGEGDNASLCYYNP